MAATPRVRPARDADLDLIAEVYERASFNPRLAAVDRFARASLGGGVFVAERDGDLVGVSGCAHFGATGWVGGVAVVPEARRAGLGRALTEAAIAWLQERGAGTIQLYATDLGRPVYERLGFVAEGACVTLGGPWQPGWRPAGVRAARADDLQPALAVDRDATGEDRAALIEVTGGRLNGPDLSLSLPDGNAPAIRALEARGQAERSRATRMRLAPPLPWRPSAIFSPFNLFWG